MHYNEWNILCDPEAAHIVYSSGVPIRAIGLDVTTRCQVNDQLVTLFRNSKNRKWSCWQTCSHAITRTGDATPSCTTPWLFLRCTIKTS